jgi:hypothetical protein
MVSVAHFFRDMPTGCIGTVRKMLSLNTQDEWVLTLEGLWISSHFADRSRRFAAHGLAHY